MYVFFDKLNKHFVCISSIFRLPNLIIHGRIRHTVPLQVLHKNQTWLPHSVSLWLEAPWRSRKHLMCFFCILNVPSDPGRTQLRLLYEKVAPSLRLDLHLLCLRHFKLRATDAVEGGWGCPAHSRNTVHGCLNFVTCGPNCALLLANNPLSAASWRHPVPAGCLLEIWEELDFGLSQTVVDVVFGGAGDPFKIKSCALSHGYSLVGAKENKSCEIFLKKNNENLVKSEGKH